MLDSHSWLFISISFLTITGQQESPTKMKRVHVIICLYLFVQISMINPINFVSQLSFFSYLNCSNSTLFVHSCLFPEHVLFFEYCLAIRKLSSEFYRHHHELFIRHEISVSHFKLVNLLCSLLAFGIYRSLCRGI